MLPRTLALILFATSLLAAEPEKLTKLRGSYESAITKATAPIHKTYTTELEKLKTEFTKSGNLEGALAVDAELKMIASRASDQPSVETADGDLLKGGHRYRYVSTKATWEEAHQHCKMLGGHLVSVGSKSEWDALLKLAEKAGNNENWWTGLRRPSGQLEPLTWSDDSKYDFKGGWPPTKSPSLAEPDRSCVLVVQVTQLWTCYPEKTKANFICEWDKP